MKNKKVIIVVIIVVLVIAGLTILQVNNINNKNVNNKKGKIEKENIIDSVSVDYKEGKILNSKDKYIEFDVIGNNNSEDVVYDINIKSKNVIDSKDFSFTLEKKINDGNYVKVVNNKSYNDITNFYRMYIDVMPKNSNTHTYKLSIDTNKDVDIEVKVNGNIVTNYKPIG